MCYRRQDPAEAEAGKEAEGVSAPQHLPCVTEGLRRMTGECMKKAEGAKNSANS